MQRGQQLIARVDLHRRLGPFGALDGVAQVCAAITRELQVEPLAVLVGAGDLAAATVAALEQLRDRRVTDVERELELAQRHVAGATRVLVIHVEPKRRDQSRDLGAHRAAVAHDMTATLVAGEVDRERPDPVLERRHARRRVLDDLVEPTRIVRSRARQVHQPAMPWTSLDRQRTMWQKRPHVRCRPTSRSRNRSASTSVESSRVLTDEMRAAARAAVAVGVAALAARTLAQSQRAQVAMWTDDERPARDRSLARVRFDPTTSCVPAPAASSMISTGTLGSTRAAVTARFERRRRTWPRGTPIVLPAMIASRDLARP